MRRHAPMRPAASPATAATAAAARAARRRSDWRTLAKLLPYLWGYNWRVLVALACLVGAKLANVGVPLLLKNLVDALDAQARRSARAAGRAARRCWSPTALLRLSTTLFTELREFLFCQGHAARGAHASRCEVFRAPARAVAALPPGAPDRRHDARHRARHARHPVADLATRCTPSCRRWSRSRWCSAILARSSTSGSPAITVGALVLYIAFTVSVTEWRTQFRRDA